MERAESFAALLEAAKAGDPHACASLWRAHAPAVAAFVRARGAAEPDDVTSEVFLQVFRRLGSFSGDEGAFRSFLYTVAHRRLVDEWRARSRRPRLADWPVGQAAPRAVTPSAEHEALVSLGERRAVELIAALTPEQRDVLMLRVLADLTVEQVATVLGKRPGAVKALQRRGLESLRRQVDGGGAGRRTHHASGGVATALEGDLP